MPDHVGDRGAAHLDPGPSRSPTYQADSEVGRPTAVPVPHLVHPVRHGVMQSPRWPGGRPERALLEFEMWTGRDRFCLCVGPGGKAESQPCQLGLFVRGGGCPAWLLSCAGGGDGDGQSDGTVAEIGDEVESASEGLDVAGDVLEGGDLAVFDLGYPGVAHGSASGYERSNVSVATRLWEPKWEPTITGTGPRQATSSHYRRS
jgi:hypothetical protein